MSWKQGLFDGLIIFFIGLTGPFLTLSTPLLIWRATKHWTPKIREIPFYSCAGVAIFLQAHSLVLNHQASQGKSLGLKELLQVLFLKFDSYLYFGKHLPESIPQVLAVGAACLIFISLASSLILPKEQQKAILIFVIFGLLIFSTAMLKLRSNESGGVGVLVIMLNPFANGGRYYFLPFLCIFYTHLILLYSSIQRLKWLGAIGMVLILFSSTTAFVRIPLEDFHWQTSIKQLETQNSAEIKIPPAPWKITICSKNRTDSN